MKKFGIISNFPLQYLSTYFKVIWVSLYESCCIWSIFKSNGNGFDWIAVEQLFITQPAVTKRIHTLEEYFGVKLFESAGRYSADPCSTFPFTQSENLAEWAWRNSPYAEPWTITGTRPFKDWHQSPHWPTPPCWTPKAFCTAISASDFRCAFCWFWTGAWASSGRNWSFML